MILTLNVTTDLFATAKAYAESINADKVGPCLDCVRTMLASPPSASSLPTPLLQTRIFTLSPGAYRWLCAMAKPPRPLDSVILDTNVADELVADVQDFFQRKVRGLGGPNVRRSLLTAPPPRCRSGTRIVVSLTAGVTCCTARRGVAKPPSARHLLVDWD